MNELQLQKLLDKYLSGALNEEERTELERTLLISPAARAQFWGTAHFHAGLARWGQESWGKKIAEPLVRPRLFGILRASRQRSVRIVALAASVILVAGISFMMLRQPAAERATSGVAIVAMTADAVWRSGGNDTTAGQIVNPGRFHLESGLVQIEFFNGTRLLAEGPADFEILSAGKAYCHSGRLRFHVPPRAHGFTVDSPALSVVDVGTEFGIVVSSGTSPEVHVFEGLVETRIPGRSDPPVPVRTGQAIRAVANAIESIPINLKAFADEKEITRRASKTARDELDSWKSAARQLSLDPTALFHLNFEDQAAWTRTIANRANPASSASLPANIIGCRWSEGRWPGKRAIQIRSSGDRLNIDVPGKMNAVTLFASLRVDAPLVGYRSLLSPDSKEPGALRWGISDQGCLRLGIAMPSKTVEPNWEVVLSKPVITSSQIGRWISLATTFDGKEVRHYLDGELIAKGWARSPGSLIIGGAEIGNWIESGTRQLPATIDEFMVLGRALSAEEIRTHASARPRAGL